MLPKLRMGHVEKLTEPAADCFLDLGLNFFGVDMGLDSLSTCTHSLGILGICLRALLLVLYGKTQDPQEIVFHLPKRWTFVTGVLDVISMPFGNQTCMVWFLDLATPVTKPMAPEVPGTSLFIVL